MSVYFQSYTAGSLGEYLEIINYLNDLAAVQYAGANGTCRLWYRGHEKQSYLLMPTLQRSSSGVQNTYSLDHLREDMRYQHFRSKCTQLVDTSPESKIEWQEILQHHLGSTRLMDWSESAISSLLFALEAFIDPRDNPELSSRRLNMTPTIWVLNPAGLNRHVYDAFQERADLFAAAAQDLQAGIQADDLVCLKMAQLLRTKRDVFFENKNEGFIDGIFCLSVIENERQAKGGRLWNLLKNEEFNPFFYLLLRYYSDGLPVAMDALPPLAIVHPYHSKRIQSQHGVFTVAPYYYIQASEQNGIWDKRPMERQQMIQDCLYQIRIARPARVAEDLLIIGERRARLYPELDVYVRDMEAKKWYI